MARSFTILLGIVLLVVGIWGMTTGGHNHNLIVFGINSSHNLVHLVSGAVALLAAAGGTSFARLFLLVFGSVYGLVAVCGFLQFAPVVSVLNLNTADNFLHFGIAVACLLFGMMRPTSA